MDGLEHEGNTPVPQGSSPHVPHQGKAGREGVWLRSRSDPSPGGDEPEEVLVAMAESGDGEAFGHLCERYKGAIHRHIRRMIKDDEMASDLTQETFLKAWQSLPKRDLERALQFRPWIYRIAHNATIDHLRKHIPDLLSLEVIGDKGIGQPSWVDGVEHDLCQRERIIRSLHAVYPKYQHCLIMRYINGLSFSEIAQELNIKEATVRANISYGRKKFIQAFLREMNGTTDRDDTEREEGR